LIEHKQSERKSPIRRLQMLRVNVVFAAGDRT